LIRWIPGLAVWLAI